MITLAEPKQHIAALWSKKENRDSVCFRCMRYVAVVEHLGRVALHNIVTGQLVILQDDEVEIFNQLPAVYTPAMKQLVDAHFLVPVFYDEHELVINLRKILRKLEDTQHDKSVFMYTILPTTACNARCYYCFENGVETVTMTEKTANDVVDFIASHCDDKTVFLSWFGGEPTVADYRIDQISAGLRDKGVKFISNITTNGYLFDEEMVDRASRLWNLESAMISLDGTEQNYNRIKDYVNAKGSPYQQIMRNIGLLLKHQIHVNLRMNFDLGNYQDFEKLVEEITRRFGVNSFLHVRAHPVNGTYMDKDGNLLHGTDEWFDAKVAELNGIAREAGYQKTLKDLPCLRYEGCEANSDSAVTITAKGTLVRCPEQFNDDQTVGTLTDGLLYPERVLSWKQFAEYDKCFGCLLYPRCNRLVNCNSKDLCTYFSQMTYHLEETIKQLVTKFESESSLITT